MAQEYIHAGRSLFEFKLVLVGVVVAELVLFMSPLLVFGRPLLRERTRGIFAYDALATAVGQKFEHRWLGWANTNTALESPDFSATTDLFAIAANVHQMKLVPINLTQVAVLLCAALLPFVPVVLMTIPLKEILQYAAKLVL